MTTPEAPVWAIETEEQIARVIGGNELDPDLWRPFLPQARAALARLANTGLLLPSGGTHSTEYGFVYRKSGASYHNKDVLAAARIFHSVGGVAVARRATRVLVEWPRTGGRYHGPWQFSEE